MSFDDYDTQSIGCCSVTHTMELKQSFFITNLNLKAIPSIEYSNMFVFMQLLILKYPENENKNSIGHARTCSCMPMLFSYMCHMYELNR